MMVATPNLENVTSRLQGVKISDMTREELIELFGAIAQRAADNALKSVGLSDENAMRDMNDMRDLLRGYRVVRKGALQRIGSMIGWMLILSVMGLVYNSKTTTEIIKLMAARVGG